MAEGSGLGIDFMSQISGLAEKVGKCSAWIDKLQAVVPVIPKGPADDANEEGAPEVGDIPPKMPPPEEGDVGMDGETDGGESPPPPPPPSEEEDGDKMDVEGGTEDVLVKVEPPTEEEVSDIERTRCQSCWAFNLTPLSLSLSLSLHTLHSLADVRRSPHVLHPHHVHHR